MLATQHLVPTDSQRGRVEPTMQMQPPLSLSDRAVPSALAGGCLPARSSSEFLQQLFADHTYLYADNHGELTSQILPGSPLNGSFLDDRFYAELPVQSADIGTLPCSSLAGCSERALHWGRHDQLREGRLPNTNPVLRALSLPSSPTSR